MSAVATKNDVSKILRVLSDFKTRFDGLEGKFAGLEGRFASLELSMDVQFEQVNNRIDAMDTKMDLQFAWVDSRINDMDTKFEGKFDKIMTSVDGFVKRLDTDNIEQAARDAQFGRLVGWARKSSLKNGVPLKDL